MSVNSRLVTAAPCPVYKLRGTPRQRGRAHGEAARDLIRALVEEHFAFLEFSSGSIVGVSFPRAQILQVSDQYLPACERFAPDLVQEVQGIAEGSGVPFNEIFSLNTFIDLADMVRPETAHNYFAHATNGCTSYGAMPPATRDGGIYLGQTFDTKAVFEPYVCALNIEDAFELPRTSAVVASFTGMVGCAGINAYGVGVVINHLHTYDARPGVPFTFAVRKMLQATTADDAIESLSHSEPASGIHYLVGDPNTLRAAETSATQFETLTPRDGFLSHANHCATDALQAIETTPSVYSLCRGNRATEMLTAHAGSIDANTLVEISSDHIGADDTICSHAELDAPRLRQYKTDFAVILDTKHRTMNLFVGSPCEMKTLLLKVES